MTTEKSINEEFLKEKFKKEVTELKNKQNEANTINEKLRSLQITVNKIEGSAESTINMLAEIVGKEEAEKFAKETLSPKDNNNSKKD